MSDRSQELGESPTAKLHHVVECGSLPALRQILEAGIDVNAPGHRQQTALMVAVGVHDLEKMKLLIENGADPERTDEFNATALRRAVDEDFADGVRYLLSLGVDRGYSPKYPLKEVNYDLQLGPIDLPEELKDVISLAEWQESLAETESSMVETGKNPTVEPMICSVQSVAVLKSFLNVGDDLNLAPLDVQRAYVGLGNEGVFCCSRRDFKKYRARRFGTSNPQRLDNPFWNDMIRIGCNAYTAREHFRAQRSLSDPVWCYQRFGSSLTQLSDGRFVQIGGEHEDFYDPDFCIYNDVVVHDGKGQFEIYGYPQKVFPPTDFHSATLVDDWIYIIGCLGYPQHRNTTQTPVFRLRLNSWKIEAVDTVGEPPNWLFKHRAEYDSARRVIRLQRGEVLEVGDNNNAELVPNAQQFEFDISSLRWTRL